MFRRTVLFFLKEDFELNDENREKILMIALELEYDRMSISQQGKLIIKSAKVDDSGEYESFYIPDINLNYYEARVVRLMVNETEKETDRICKLKKYRKFFIILE